MERNTHFAGFAKALLKEMLGSAGYIDFNEYDTNEIDYYENLIAQRAHDLVRHTLTITPDIMQHTQHLQTVDEAIPYVPDLAKLPEVSE